MKRGKKGIDLYAIISLYNDGLPVIQIAEKLNCTLSNISRRLKKAGYKVLQNNTKKRYSRRGRYYINQYFFETIDTEEQAYFLGIMYSDGSVSDDFFYLKLTDEDVVQKFKKALQFEGPIEYKHYKEKNYKDTYKLAVNCKKMVKDLIQLGCVKNKTKVIELPNIRKDLIRHFIRGFFDGDGCLSLNNNVYHCRFDITCASEKFLKQIRPIITEQALTNGNLCKESKYEVWHLRYSGQQVKQILDWLYTDSTVYMERKYNKYLLLSSL